MNKNGRNPVTIDWNKVEEFAEAGSSGTEIAAQFGIHPNTLYRRVEEEFNVSFSDYITSKKSRGDALIKLHQFKKALGQIRKGDTQLLLMLGKERLGQGREKENEVPNQNNIDNDHSLMNENHSLREEIYQLKQKLNEIQS